MYPIAQLQAIEKRKQAQRGWGTFPRSHSKWQAQILTLDSHVGVYHWVGEMADIWCFIWALGMPLPLPWPLTSFSVPLLQALRLTQMPDVVPRAFGSSRPLKVARTADTLGSW